MKKIIIVLAFVLIPSFLFAGDVFVQGYQRDSNHDGIKDTYVNPYHRTTPDNNPYNNYSTQGNTNPWTREQGTVSPTYNNPYSNPSRRGY